MSTNILTNKKHKGLVQYDSEKVYSLAGLSSRAYRASLLLYTTLEDYREFLTEEQCVDALQLLEDVSDLSRRILGRLTNQIRHQAKMAELARELNDYLSSSLDHVSEEETNRYLDLKHRVKQLAVELRLLRDEKVSTAAKMEVDLHNASRKASKAGKDKAAIPLSSILSQPENPPKKSQ